MQPKCAENTLYKYDSSNSPKLDCCLSPSNTKPKIEKQDALDFHKTMVRPT